MHSEDDSERLLQLLRGKRRTIAAICDITRRMWHIAVYQAGICATLRNLEAKVKRLEHAPSVDNDELARLHNTFISLSKRCSGQLTSAWSPDGESHSDAAGQILNAVRIMKSIKHLRHAVSLTPEECLRRAISRSCLSTKGDREEIASLLLNLYRTKNLINYKGGRSQNDVITCRWPSGEQTLQIHHGNRTTPEYDINIFNSLRVALRLLPARLHAADIHFWVHEQTREHYRACFSADCIRAFQELSAVVNRQTSRNISLDSITSLFASCRGARFYRLLLETASNAGYFSPIIQRNRLTPKVNVRPAKFDPEFLLTSLFGVPFSIPGLSDLFGGGLRLGLPTLKSKSGSGKEHRQHTEQNGFGRVSLIRGEYGAGKSILSQLMAVDIARKGGIAIVIVLESSFEETIAGLAGFGIDTSGDSFAIVRKLEELGSQIRNSSKGILAVFSHFDDVPDSSSDAIHVPVAYDSILGQIEEYSEVLSGANSRLRLIVIDPINALLQHDQYSDSTETDDPHGTATGASPESSGTTLRRERVRERFQTLKTLQMLKKSGMNLIVTAEEDALGWMNFGEDIADTVIRLSTNRLHNPRYTKRVLSITKSRLQREHRGEHPFSIVSGTGFDITPTTAAIAAGLNARVRKQIPAGKFGLKSLDRILSCEISTGDVILLRGPVGTLKTQIGIAFLNGSRPLPGVPSSRPPGPAASRSLLISNRLINQDSLATKFQSSIRKPGALPRICAIPKGFYTAGHIFQLIRQSFEDARAEGVIIDRVLLDNPSEWTHSAPLTATDPGFPQTLIGLFLKSRGVATLVTDRLLAPESEWSQTLLAEADIRIDLELAELNGVEQVTLRVRKTDSMLHDRQPHVVNFTGNDIELEEAWFDIGKDGTAAPLKVDILGHVETVAQRNYLDSKLSTIRSAIAPNANLQILNRYDLGFMLDFARTGDSSRVQIIQIDECELDWGKNKGLRKLPLGTFEADLKSVKERLRNHVLLNDHSIIAAPLYDNLSLLALQGNPSDYTDHLGDWQQLADFVEGQQKDNNTVVFDFPKGTAENYNCLFLEILLSLIRSAQQSADSKTKQAAKDLETRFFSQQVTQQQDITELLEHELAAKAAALFARLGRAAYRYQLRQGRDEHRQSDSASLGRYHVCESARIVRHWFTTLYQHIASGSGANYHVTHLPNGVSTSGAWFVGVLSRSRASDLADSIIKQLTSRLANIDRLNQFVGLPVREDSYTIAGTDITKGVIPLKSLRPEFFWSVSRKPIQRSGFKNYISISDVIAGNLIQLLSLNEESVLPTIDEDAARCVANMRESIRMVMKSQTDTAPRTSIRPTR